MGTIHQLHQKLETEEIAPSKFVMRFNDDDVDEVAMACVECGVRSKFVSDFVEADLEEIMAWTKHHVCYLKVVSE